MSVSEIDAGRERLELEPIKLPILLRVDLALRRTADKRRERKMIGQFLEEAHEYEKKATERSAAQPVELGSLLLNAGRAYLNARRPRQALFKFELARPHLETYKVQSGTHDGFYRLARLYQVMECAYKETGQEQKSEAIHEEAVGLAMEQEEIYGIHTEFLPNCETVTGPAKAAA